MRYLFHIQSPLVIVYLVIVEYLVIVDMFSGPIVYFSMYFSCNSGFSCYSEQFAADGQIHYYERRLYKIFQCYSNDFAWAIGIVPLFGAGLDINSVASVTNKQTSR